MISNTQEQVINANYEALKPELDDRARRLWAATEARSLGHSGIATVARAMGLAASTVRLGKKELTSPSRSPGSPWRVCHQGAGHPVCIAQDLTLLQALDALVEPAMRGDPIQFARRDIM
jgi:hypothetical protein